MSAAGKTLAPLRYWIATQISPDTPGTGVLPVEPAIRIADTDASIFKASLREHRQRIENVVAALDTAGVRREAGGP
jgi:hypothetical protein